MIYHKFSQGTVSYTLHEKNVNVMLELALSDDVQKTSTATPLTFLTELCLFVNFSVKIVSAQ